MPTDLTSLCSLDWGNKVKWKIYLIKESWCRAKQLILMIFIPHKNPCTRIPVARLEAGGMPTLTPPPALQSPDNNASNKAEDEADGPRPMLAGQQQEEPYTTCTAVNTFS